MTSRGLEPDDDEWTEVAFGEGQQLYKVDSHNRIVHLLDHMCSKFVTGITFRHLDKDFEHTNHICSLAGKK
jgi:hypothetical protein